jgi:hypothetical protein
MYCFDGAFVGGLLGGVFEFGGDLIDQNYGYCIAHREDFWTSGNAKAASGAGIIDCNFHTNLP